MNNFEKWKDELTLNKFLVFFADECPADKCPAFSLCKEIMGCENALKTWAEQEAGE